ncbi:hypothetical protein BDV97DRAFT_374020 [Delphinella strobiligena]|nr:hypothetical protein BDV97DRAFT_374020 [Delphinella strobiligena]
MRAATRFLAAVLIIMILVLINRDIGYIRVLQDFRYDPKFRLSQDNGAVDTKPHEVPQGIPSEDDFVTSVRESPKTDISRIMFVSTTTLNEETRSHTPAPVSSGPDQIVVIGRTSKEDTSWMEQLDTWQTAIYSVDNQNSTLHTSMNKGREANVYLTYLVDNYNRLPSTIAFVHPHERGYPQAWHTDAPDYSNRNGYANLRCIPNPGCPDEIEPFREPYDETRTAENAFSEAWRSIFGDQEIPHVSATPCCAQFAVSKEQVLKRPLSFYTRARRWLQNTPLDDDTSGRVFEYLWHIIFGQEPVYCPDLQQCYKDVYNR